MRDKAILLMLLETGIRRTELISLKIGDIDIRAMTAVIRRGKGGKARVVVYGPDSADALRRWIRLRPARCGDALWANGSGDPLGYAGVGQIVRARGDQAGIPGLHPHVFRHTWAHYCLEAGVGDQNVITLAGWTTGAQLARYGRAMAVQRAQAAAHANPVAQVARQQRRG